MAITTKDIHAVADQIVAEGGSPTLANVRKALGGGSFTTISEAMQEWKASRQAVTVPIREPAPAVVSERLNEFVGELWVVALDMANGRLQTEREALEQARQDMEQARQEAADLADQVSAELEQVQASNQKLCASLDEAGNEIEHQAGEINKLTGALAKANEDAHTAQAALTEAQARAAQLSTLLEREQEARVKVETEMRRAIENVARLTAEKAGAEQRAVEQQEARISAEKSAEKAVDYLRNALAVAMKEAKVAADEAAELRGAKMASMEYFNKSEN